MKNVKLIFILLLGFCFVGQSLVAVNNPRRRARDLRSRSGEKLGFRSKTKKLGHVRKKVASAKGEISIRKEETQNLPPLAPTGEQKHLYSLKRELQDVAQKAQELQQGLTSLHNQIQATPVSVALSPVSSDGDLQVGLEGRLRPSLVSPEGDLHSSALSELSAESSVSDFSELGDPVGLTPPATPHSPDESGFVAPPSSPVSLHVPPLKLSQIKKEEPFSPELREKQEAIRIEEQVIGGLNSLGEQLQAVTNSLQGLLGKLGELGEHIKKSEPATLRLGMAEIQQEWSQADAEKKAKATEALFFAVRNKDVDGAKKALKKGADKKDVNGNTPLHHAAGLGDVDMVKFLLQEGFEADASNNDRNTPLHLAAMRDNLTTIRLLVEALGEEVNLDVRNDDGDTPLHVAAQLGRSDVVAYLVDKKANTQVLNKNQKTPLDLAKENNHDGVVNLLQEYQAKFKIPRFSKPTPQQIAESK